MSLIEGKCIELDNLLAFGSFNFNSSNSNTVVLRSWNIGIGFNGAVRASGVVNITVGGRVRQYSFSGSTAGLTSRDFGRWTLHGCTYAELDHVYIHFGDGSRRRADSFNTSIENNF